MKGRKPVTLKREPVVAERIPARKRAREFRFVIETEWRLSTRYVFTRRHNAKLPHDADRLWRKVCSESYFRDVRMYDNGTLVRERRALGSAEGRK